MRSELMFESLDEFIEEMKTHGVAGIEIREDNVLIVKFSDGVARWYRGKKLFFMELPDGTQEWYKNGFLHRDEGPASICKGVKDYYVEGRHLGTAYPDGYTVCYDLDRKVIARLNFNLFEGKPNAVA